MENSILAFADEYGNNSLDYLKQGSHFIVASIIVSEADRDHLEASLEVIRKKYFQTGEIKSKNVSDNHQRRLRILEELVKLPFNIYALVVDKKRLITEGFKYKESFYKFLSGLLYKELFKAYPKLKLSVDELGGNEFLASFKKYVNKNHIRNLFSGSEFLTGDSKLSIIIQLADFIAGTLGRCYDQTKNLAYKDIFLKTLEPRLVSINHFPKEYRSIDVHDDSTESNVYDRQIAEYGKRLAIDFIETKKIKSQEDIDQLNCIKLLLLHLDVFGSKKYLSAKEILNHLTIGRKTPLNVQQFRGIIGKLRDQGVLIASKSKGEKKGYRLPTSASDLIKFIEHGKSIALPLLHRMNVCRERVLLATNNSLDLLDGQQFEQLKRILSHRDEML